MEQQFSLSWKNFHGNLSNGFAGLLGTGEFVDVTLAVEGQLLQAHRVVLSICSPYFKRMFQLNPCQHPIVVLRDVSHRAMKDLLHFMYNGEVSVRQEELSSFISTAETLEIKGLTNKQTDDENSNCVQKQLSPSSLDNNAVHNSRDKPQENNDSYKTNLHHKEDVHQVPEHPQQLVYSKLNRLAALKRKSEEFLVNNYNLDGKHNDQLHQPEKKKIREKQILNRHKIVNNHPRAAISVKNFDAKQLRNEINVPLLNMFNEASANIINKKSEKSSFYNEVRNTSVSHDDEVAILDSIKKENEAVEESAFDESPVGAGIATDKGNDVSSDSNMVVPISPQVEQDDGVYPTDLSSRISWPVSDMKAFAPSTCHTIVTIPQKEDGKKKYPQRSCRFCWRAGRRRDTRFMCQQCLVPLCKTNCFEQHQTQCHIIPYKDDGNILI